MKKILALSLCLSYALISFGQNERKFSLFLGLYGNWPVYDAYNPHNSSGAGVKMDFYLNTKSVVKPKLEVNANAFMSNKIFEIDNNGDVNPDKNGLTCLLIGPASNFRNNFEVSLIGGPCFIGAGTHLGLKPSVVYYLGKKKIIKTELSFTHIFQHGAPGNEPFGFISFGLGVRLH